MESNTFSKNVIFGNKVEFAIEIRDLTKDRNYLLGEIYVWINEVKIGHNYKTMIGTPLQFLKRSIVEGKFRGNQNFNGLSEVEIFNFLDSKLFGPTDADVFQISIDAKLNRDFLVFTNWSDAFDTWTIFLIESSEYDTLIWKKSPLEEIHFKRIPPYTYRKVVGNCVKYLEEAEIILLEN
jgi:hypothetical protein